MTVTGTPESTGNESASCKVIAQASISPAARAVHETVYSLNFTISTWPLVSAIRRLRKEPLPSRLRVDAGKICQLGYGVHATLSAAASETEGTSSPIAKSASAPTGFKEEAKAVYTEVDFISEVQEQSDARKGR